MSQAKRVVRHALLDGGSDLRRGSEEAVRRCQPTESLVGALEIVRVDEELEPPGAVVIVRKHRPAQKLIPKRFPESLHLPERLWMLRAALDVVDAFAPQRFLKDRRPSPRRVLSTVVREHFPGRTKRRDAPLQRLHHQGRLLMVCQGVTQQESRVVVHEGCQVNPLMASQQKREDVRLPQLVGLRPLEAPRRALSRRPLPRCLLNQPRLV